MVEREREAKQRKESTEMKQQRDESDAEKYIKIFGRRGRRLHDKEGKENIHRKDMKRKSLR